MGRERRRRGVGGRRGAGPHREVAGPELLGRRPGSQKAEFPIATVAPPRLLQRARGALEALRAGPERAAGPDVAGQGPDRDEQRRPPRGYRPSGGSFWCVWSTVWRVVAAAPRPPRGDSAEAAPSPKLRQYVQDPRGARGTRVSKAPRRLVAAQVVWLMFTARTQDWRLVRAARAYVVPTTPRGRRPHCKNQPKRRPSRRGRRPQVELCRRYAQQESDEEYLARHASGERHWADEHHGKHRDEHVDGDSDSQGSVDHW